MLFWEDIIALLVCLKYYYFYVNMNFCLESFWIWIFIPQLKGFTLKLCQVALHIKNSLFIIYLLEDEQELSLPAPWYVSNVSIIFDCSMLYYLLFWTLLGFIIHFYIIFGTNLLNGGPAQNCCFLPVLGFQRKGISNGVQTEWNLREHDFLTEYNSGDLDPTLRHVTGGH